LPITVVGASSPVSVSAALPPTIRSMPGLTLARSNELPSSALPSRSMVSAEVRAP
jgi:hypothetical protein